jgi:peptidoglycan/LPS O-acetylase OafA/YrhL
MTQGLSLYLDLLRGVAAVQVVLFHLGWLETVGIGQHAWNRWGHEAVVIFFVLSGFVIRHAVAVKEQSFSDYAVNRLSRLYSVALPCIGLTLIFDAIGGRLAPELYRNAGLFDSTAMVMLRLGFSVLMSNESWFSITPGSNVPYWSVCYEFWYYALFAAYIYTAGWRRSAILLVLALVAGPAILLLLPIWLLGVWAYTAQLGKSRLLVWCSFLQLSIVVACHVYFDLPKVGTDLLEPLITRNLNWSMFVLSDTLLGLSFALHLVAAKQLDQPLLRWLSGGARGIRAIAARSFTLYLLHMPLMMLLAAVCFATDRWFPAWMIWGITLGLPLALAPTIESRRHTLRAQLRRLIDGMVRPPVRVSVVRGAHL